MVALAITHLLPAAIGVYITLLGFEVIKTKPKATSLQDEEKTRAERSPGLLNTMKFGGPIITIFELVMFFANLGH